VLERLLDDSYSRPVRDDVATLTIARLTTNAVYRFAPPFVATIARGLDVELSEIGVALAVTELCGLASPLLGRIVDRRTRRWSMVSGLLGITIGAAVAGASTGIVMFTVGLFAVASSKIVFDVGLGTWIADHVPYARRGRVVGIVETSWALGLLIGVSALGLVAAVSSWRWSYVAGAGAVLAMAIAVSRRAGTPVASEGAGTAAVPTRRAPVGKMPMAGWLAVAGLFGLMSAAQCVFITFGPWLEDEFGVTTVGLVAATFGIGVLELGASTTSAARTDRWGKERSVMLGAAVMVPAGLVLGALEQTLVPGLILLGTFIAAFEFAIVSALPIGPTLVPGAPGRGLGTMVAVGTLGRGITSIAATRLFESRGLTATAGLAAVLAALAGAAMGARRHLLSRGAETGPRLSDTPSGTERLG
jgi:DHA1 family inner membrane transport protein